jgi:hypothetical protein
MIKLLLFFFLAVNLTAARQNTRTESRQQAELGPVVNGCEYNSARLFNLDQSAGKGTLIIAIARRGKNEGSQVLSRRRLHNLRTYLVEFLKRNSETIVTAEGDPVAGLGRIEVYVSGKLAEIFEMRRNEDFFVGSCEDSTEEDKLLYDSRRSRRPPPRRR